MRELEKREMAEIRCSVSQWRWNELTRVSLPQEIYYNKSDCSSFWSPHCCCVIHIKGFGTLLFAVVWRPWLKTYQKAGLRRAPFRFMSLCACKNKIKLRRADCFSVGFHLDQGGSWSDVCWLYSSRRVRVELVNLAPFCGRRKKGALAAGPNTLIPTCN